MDDKPTPKISGDPLTPHSDDFKDDPYVDFDGVLLFFMAFVAASLIIFGYLLTVYLPAC